MRRRRPPSRAARCDASSQTTSPALLLVALVAVPIIGYSSVAMMPLGARLDRLREIATAFTLIAGMALVLFRLRVERRAVARADERLRLLATACEQAGELIIIVKDQRVVYANDAFCRAVGYSLEELEQVPPMQLVAAQSRDDIAQLRETLRQPQVIRANTVMSRRDGSTFPTSWVAAPILDASGRIAHVVSVVRDMTEDERLRAQLVRSERLSAIGEFVSGAAHEINNPLQSILGTLELLLNERRDDAALRADLERAAVEAARAGRIVRNLLRFVRRSPSERILIDINEAVKATVAIRSYELEVAGVRVVEQYAAGLPLVLAAATRFNRCSSTCWSTRSRRWPAPSPRACSRCGRNSSTATPRRGVRHRSGRPRRDRRQDLRAVLHHQDTGRQHGARAFDVARHRARASRRARDRPIARRLVLPPDAARRRLSRAARGAPAATRRLRRAGLDDSRRR